MSEIVIPQYIQDHLDRIVKENGFIDYSVEVKHGTQVGEGFMSELTCITIAERNSEKKLNLVCKMAPLNKNRRKDFISDIAFAREADFYTKVMPCFDKFQKEKNLPINDQFMAYPKCYGATVDNVNEHFAIILDDLRAQEFKMWPKVKTSPIENVRLAMREIGKFHALSIAMKDQRPTEFAKFEQFTDIFKNFFENKNTRDMFINSYDSAIASFQREDYKNIMRKLKENFRGLFNDILDEKSSVFGVICHGDFWNNNMMFKFDKNDVAEDVRFLDWQILRHGSPAIDLCYNLFTSTDKTLRDKEYDNLLQVYYKSLSKTVKLLGSNPDELFTFENLQSEMKRCGVYALLLAPIVIQVSQASSSDVSNLDEMCDNLDDKEKTMVLVNSLSNKAQLEYARRLSDVFEDVIRLGYCEKIL